MHQDDATTICPIRPIGLICRERVRCHACQERFLLAVASGPDEPRLAYQLDPPAGATLGDPDFAERPNATEKPVESL